MMAHVKNMVDYFEDLAADKRLSLSPFSDKDYGTTKQHVAEDDDLLSYGSNNDTNNDDYEQEEPTDTQDQNQISVFPTTLVVSSHSEVDIDDDQMLVYSSDDDSEPTAPQTLITLSPDPFHDRGSNDWNGTLTPKTSNLQVLPDNDVEKSNCTFDITNAQGQSPLILASISCLAEAMKIFITQGCDVNLRDSNGISPLEFVSMSEIRDERLVCMKLLLENGANVNCQDHQGCTPLHRAAATLDCSESIKLLLSFGACPNIQDNQGNTALHEATRHRNIENIKTLTEAKACSSSCVCKHSSSPPRLQIEIYEDEKETDLLPNLQSGVGSPPNQRSLEIWNRFFENAANASISREKENEEYEYSLHVHNAIVAGDVNHLRSLLEIGHDANEVDRYGNSPLHIAARKGDLPIIITLVENGAEINCTNENDETPINICWAQGYTRCADYLLCHEKGNRQVTRNFDLFSYASNLISAVFNLIACMLLKSEHSTKANAIPKDVAVALLEAKSNNKLKVGQLATPQDLKIALEKAGLRVKAD